MIRNFKIKVNPQESELVQKLSFLVGYCWLSNQKIIKHTDKPYLFFYNDMEITYSHADYWFIQHDHRELTFEQFLNEIETELNDKRF